MAAQGVAEVSAIVLPAPSLAPARVNETRREPAPMRATTRTKSILAGTGRKTGPSGPREKASLLFHVPAKVLFARAVALRPAVCRIGGLEC
jgi:hypothetical protein